MDCGWMDEWISGFVVNVWMDGGCGGWMGKSGLQQPRHLFIRTQEPSEPLWTLVVMSRGFKI